MCIKEYQLTIKGSPHKPRQKLGCTVSKASDKEVITEHASNKQDKNLYAH